MYIGALFIVWLQVCIASADELRLEIENLPGVDNVVQISNASNGKVANLADDDIVRYEMCVHSPVDLIISNILYSNDDSNTGDVVSVFIDGNLIGYFNSLQPEISNAASEWNNIRSSGQIGDVVNLDYGRHMLLLHVTAADISGIELDAIDFDIGNFSLGNKLFACDKYCFPDINYSSIQIPVLNEEKLKIRQYSKATVCSEEENVKIGLYHDSAQSFEIKATRPKYKSYANNRDSDFRGCKLANPAWEFLDVALQPDTSVNRTPRAVLTVDNADNLLRVVVVFDMSGFSVTRGDGESRTAGRLFTLFGNISANNPVLATLTYKGKSDILETTGEHVYTVDNPSHTWEIPDNTWEYNSNNNITLSIRNQDNDFTDLYLDELSLEKRPTISRSVKIADDGQYVFEGIYQEPKSLNQTAMSIKVNDGRGELQNFDDVTSLRLYMKKPYDDGYSQIFVINDDGHTRIQPVTPHGFDWTPFGSSLIIGPNRATNVRPFASIKSISLRPKDLRLKIIYNDGSHVILLIVPKLSETKVYLDDYTYGEGRKRSDLALITFLSTWIEDGFANTDRMAVDGEEKENILEDFNELTGSRVNFYRKCISRLNTQSPDVEISVNKTGGNIQ